MQNAKVDEAKESQQSFRWLVAFLVALSTEVLAVIGFIVACALFNPWMFILTFLWIIIAGCNIYEYGRKLDYWESYWNS